MLMSEPEDSLNQASALPGAEPQSPEPPDFLRAHSQSDCINDLYLVPLQTPALFPTAYKADRICTGRGGLMLRSDACVLVNVDAAGAGVEFLWTEPKNT